MILWALIYITALLLVLSKFLDCWTTVQAIKHADQERNRIMRPFMKRFGIGVTVWGVFVLVVLVVGLSLLLLNTVFVHWIWRVMFVVIGLVDAAFQFAVAHTNKSRRLNALTRLVLKMRVYK